MDPDTKENTEPQITAVLAAPTGGKRERDQEMTDLIFETSWDKDVQERLFGIAFPRSITEPDAYISRPTMRFAELARLNIMHYQHSLLNLQLTISKSKGVMNDTQIRELRDTLREYCTSNGFVTAL
jgi:hypothetical protein